MKRYAVGEVHLTDTLLGTGRRATVREASVTGTRCAAKIVSVGAKLPPNSEALETERKAVVRGCELWNKLRHPNIVSFLGITDVPDYPLPVPLVEYLPANLHRFLTRRGHALQSIPLGLKISILRNVACGLSYLHGQSPPIFHGHISAEKVFLDSEAVAKISVDVGVTVLPQPLEMSPYMPPEVTNAQSPLNGAVDVFSFGVLSLFSLTHETPSDILPPTSNDEQSVSRSEIERRAQHIEKIIKELGKGHPLVQMITKCLAQQPNSRPTVLDLVATHSLLWQASVMTPDPYQDKPKITLVLDMHALSCAHVKMRGELESHDRELRDQIRGLLQGMARQREMLPHEYSDEEKEIVTEQEIAYIANFVGGIKASRLGRELGVSEDALANIDCDPSGRRDENWKRSKVLQEWIRNTEEPTWTALVEALGSITQNRVAETLKNDKGLQYCTDKSLQSQSDQQQAKVSKKTPGDGGSDTDHLESQLKKTRETLERAQSRLAETRRELEEANRSQDELQEAVSSKDEQIRSLRLELKAEELFRKELAEENLQLKLELDQLKRK